MAVSRLFRVGLAVVLSACASVEGISPAERASVSTPAPSASLPEPEPSASPPEPAIALDPATMDARYQAALPLFAYDAGPLELDRELASSPAELVIEDVSYASPKGGRVPAFLVAPENSGPHPGLILMHGSGGDRDDMLREAQAYARLGVIALLISAPPGRSDPPGAFVTFTPADRDQQIQLIVDLRRAVDVLAEVGADPERIGYVGYSYGGAMGAQLAGVEHRIGAYVLDVADGGLVEHFTGPDDTGGELAQLAGEAREAWLAAMEPIEPLYFVRHAAPSALLFQSARTDELVTAEDSLRLHEHASEPKEVVWYDSGHALPVEAWCDQADWLRGHLGFENGAFRPDCG